MHAVVPGAKRSSRPLAPGLCSCAPPGLLPFQGIPHGILYAMLQNSKSKCRQPTATSAVSARLHCITPWQAANGCESSLPDAFRQTRGSKLRGRTEMSEAIRRLRTTLRVNAKLLKGTAVPALIKNRQVIRAGYRC